MIPDIRDLPFPGQLSCFTRNPIQRCRHIVDLSGKHVLLIGFSDAQAVTLAETEKIGTATRLTLWADHIDMDGSNFDIVIGDICKTTQFKCDTFDAVVFSAVFEHLGDIEGAFAEVRRVLKHGGLCISEFGPVWESSTGHHLYLDPGHPVLDFTQRQLPSHFHLIYDRETIHQYLCWRGLSPHLSDRCVHSIYDSDLVSRNYSYRYFHAAKNFFTVLMQENYTSEVSQTVKEALYSKGHKEFESFEGGFWCMIAHKL